MYDSINLTLEQYGTDKYVNQKSLYFIFNNWSFIKTIEIEVYIIQKQFDLCQGAGTVYFAQGPKYQPKIYTPVQSIPGVKVG